MKKTTPAHSPLKRLLFLKAIAHDKKLRPGCITVAFDLLDTLIDAKSGWVWGTFEDLLVITGFNEKKLKRILADLRACGWLEYKRVGRKNVWEFRWDKADEAEQASRNRVKALRPKPVETEITDAPSPTDTTDTPAVESTAITVTSTDDRTFEHFWSVCPKQEKMQQARELFVQAIKEVSASTLIQKMGEYARSVQGKEPRYIASPVTWLRDKRWTDNYNTITAANPYAAEDAAYPPPPPGFDAGTWRAYQRKLRERQLH
jgi:hypothetical protein